MDELIKEGQEKFEQTLRKYRVARVASLLSHKARLEEQIKEVDARIQEVAKIVVIPEGEYIRD